VLKKVLGYGLLIVLAVGGGGLSYLYLRQPSSRPAKNGKVPMTPERIARGRYIFRLADCEGCHTPHEMKDGAMAAVTDRQGAGQVFVENGFRAGIPNITPDPETGIGAWTDGEKIRAIREGIGKTGNALFPMMPYEHFRHMADDDVEALVAYLNTLSPVRNTVQRTELPLFLKVMIKGAPQPVEEPVKRPAASNQRMYGEYLVNLGLCVECHTPGEGGRLDSSKRYAGGRRFDINGKVVFTPNITPDPHTGIGNWTVDYFKERFHRYKNGTPPDAAGKFTLMPWHNLAQLPDTDLEAIYAFLREQAPIENKVQNVVPSLSASVNE
jgi:mono/diheme cytochrome c family protein